MANEKKTENIVRKRLQKAGYYRDKNLVVEEHQSDSPRIDKLLKNASKKGGEKGYPEFIVSSTALSDFLIVIECKADSQKHNSRTLDKYADYAVDGVLLYASHLSKAFDVLAIAVSGETEAALRISHYLHLQGAKNPVEFHLADILSFGNYHDEFLKSDAKIRQDYEALRNFSRALNEELHAKKIREAHRSLLICGILVALNNEAFKRSFKAHRTARNLANNLVETIINEFKTANLIQERIAGLEQSFSFIRTNTTLTSDKDFFVSLIEQLDDNVNKFVRTHKYYDAIGEFYVQFLRFANNDKGLGIVLTPPHIAELFACLAEANKESVVFDNCCGTSGLLIASMKQMLKDAAGNDKTKKIIKKQQLIGIEYEADIYALAISNMFIHGDGKANIFSGDCFMLAHIIKEKYKPTVGLLNPPYKTPASVIEELDFVINNLETLQPNGKCIAIVPFSCAIGDTNEIQGRRRKILQNHTLDAVMSMPSDLFHDSKSSVVSCVLVITAHKPHPRGKKTWFGYWRDDGFVKVKSKGRIDAHGRWEGIRDKWLTAFRNKEAIRGLSIMKEVCAEDEWCAEAYMEPDWSNLDKEALAKTFREFAIHKLLTEIEND